MAQNKWIKVATASVSAPKAYGYHDLVSHSSDWKAKGYGTKITLQIEKETWSRTYHYTLWRTSKQIKY